MQRRRQPSALEYGNPAARFEEIELAIETNPLADSKPLVEVEQVHATAQNHMLAIVDDFGDFAIAAAGRIGRRASAQEGTRFEQLDFVSGVTQSGRRGESGESAAGNKNLWHSVVSQFSV